MKNHQEFSQEQNLGYLRYDPKGKNCGKVNRYPAHYGGLVADRSSVLIKIPMFDMICKQPVLNYLQSDITVFAWKKWSDLAGGWAAVARIDPPIVRASARREWRDAGDKIYAMV